MDIEFLERHHYKLEGKLGSGSFGQVYKAYDSEHQRYVAIKQVANKDCVEVDIMKQLNHQNIVGYLESISNIASIYLIMEYIDGGTLVDYKPTGEEETSIIAKQMLSALNHMHSLGIVHRDMKPANILMNHNKQVKIADFGLSFQYRNTRQLLFDRCGTFYYMAPEQLLNQQYSKQIDIWSCGLIIFILLTGYHPFKKYNKEEFVNSLRTMDLYIPENISPLASDLLRKLICVERMERYSATQALSHPFITRKINDTIPLSVKDMIVNFKKKTQLITVIKALMVLQDLRCQSPIGSPEPLPKSPNLRTLKQRTKLVIKPRAILDANTSPQRIRHLPMVRQRNYSNYFDRSQKSIDFKLPQLKKYL